MTGIRLGLVIDGRVVDGELGSYEVTNPARPDEVVLQAPAASVDQLDAAVAAARRAAPGWAGLDHGRRTQTVIEAARAAAAAVETLDLARLLTREHGKVHIEAIFDVATIGAMADAFAPLVATATAPATGTPVSPPTIDPPAGKTLAPPIPRTEVEWMPHGVVGAILPFNWPVAVMGNKVMPALLTGNTVVAKAPPTCPGAVLAVAAALAAALPPGVFNVVNGPSPELGRALVVHPGIDMVSFTGGVPTGRAVMAAAAARTTPLVLELGGNDAAIVAPDLDITPALADQLFNAAFVTAGQVCMAIKRLYVHEDRVEEAVAALVDRLSTEVVGDGLADGVTMGPVHLPGARDRVERMLAEAEQAGATVHRPGRIRDDDAGSGGYFVSPALVVGAPATAAIVNDEQFAPALPLIAYRTLDQAVTAANDSEYGLCASIWSGDDEVAASVAHRLEAGTVFVNTHGMSAMDFRAPMGGWKASGFGVELGAEGMRAFTRPRTILVHPAPGGGGR